MIKRIKQGAAALLLMCVMTVLLPWCGITAFAATARIAFSDPSAYYSYTFDNGMLRSNEIRSIASDGKGHILIAESGAGFSGLQHRACHQQNQSASHSLGCKCCGKTGCWHTDNHGYAS